MTLFLSVLRGDLTFATLELPAGSAAAVEKAATTVRRMKKR